MHIRVINLNIKCEFDNTRNRNIPDVSRSGLLDAGREKEPENEKELMVPRCSEWAWGKV